MIFAYLMVFPGYSQSSTVLDSLEAQLAPGVTSEAQVKILLQLADLTLYNDPDRSLEFAKNAVAISGKLSNPYYLTKAYHRLGSAYWSKGNLIRSLDILQKSLESSVNVDDPELISQIYMRIGAIYSASDDNVKGIYYYSKAIPYFTLTEDPFIKFAVYNNIGKALLDISYLDSAGYYFDYAKNLRSEIPDRFQPILLFNLADLSYQNGDIETAIELMNECDSLAIAYNDIRARVRVSQLMAEIRLEEGRLTEAQELIEFATREAEKTKVKELIAITHNTYSRVLELIDRKAEALEALKTSRSYFDSIQSTQARNKLELYNFDETEAEKDKLRKQQEIAELEASNQQIIAIGAIIIAILMIAIVISYIRRQNIIRNQNKDLKDKNQLIEEQRKQLDYLSKFKTKLMAIMAHDVKGPIQTIYGVIDLLNQKLMSPDEIKDLMPALNAQLSQVNLLLNNIFEWSRTEMNDTSFTPDEINLKSLITNNIAEYHQTAKDKELKILNEVAVDQSAYADQKMIQIVVRNLLYNAIKYSKKGGEIRFFGEVSGNSSIFSIQDQGTGMDEETIEKLFGFETISTEGTAREIGTGFGLIICKDFININNGTIKVSSVPGQGSTFTIELPLA